MEIVLLRRSEFSDGMDVGEKQASEDLGPERSGDGGDRSAGGSAGIGTGSVGTAGADALRSVRTTRGGERLL